MTRVEDCRSWLPARAKLPAHRRYSVGPDRHHRNEQIRYAPLRQHGCLGRIAAPRQNRLSLACFALPPSFRVAQTRRQRRQRPLIVRKRILPRCSTWGISP